MWTFEDLIGQALHQLRDLEPRAHEHEHEVAKRELDALLITEAAERRGLRVLRLTPQMQVIRRDSLAVGFFQNMGSPLTALDRAVTHDKLLTKRILAQDNIPLARGEVVRSMDRALAALHRIGPPVVVKPIAGSHGHGVTVNVRDEDELKDAAREAFDLSSRLLVEEMITSIDLRVMTVAGQAVAAMLRVPANVVGDGTSSIRELIDQKNAVRAGNAYLRHCPIVVNPFTEHHLAGRGLTLDSAPSAGQRVFLHYKANLSSGGDSYEIIDVIHPEILRLAERAAACISSAYHAGVDILLERFDVAPDEQRCIVCELNLNNEMPIHIYPLFGTSSATDDETIEGYFFRAKAQLESGLYRLDPAARLDSSPRDEGNRLEGKRADAPADGTPHHSLQLTAALAGAVSTPVEPEDHRTPLRLDQYHLGQALQRAGFEKVRFRGRLIHSTRSGQEVLFERSGRTIFAGALNRQPAGLRALLRAAGLPTLRRGQKPTGPALSVLMVDGEPAASVVLAPPSVRGDGATSLGELIEQKQAARLAHPFLRHLPIKHSLTSDDGLAKRSLRRDQVLAEGELAHLSHSPLDTHGVDTVGIAGCPFPDLAETAAAVVQLIGQVPVASVTFIAQAITAAPGRSWAVWTFDPDPRIGQFAFPWAGEASPLYDQVAATLIAGQRYVLPAS